MKNVYKLCISFFVSIIFISSAYSQAKVSETQDSHQTTMSVRILGSGSPGYNVERGEASVLLRAGTNTILIDMGNGTIGALSKAGVKVNEITSFFLTHHHIDHEAEIFQLLISALIGKKAPNIVGPSGIKKLCDFVISFYEKDILYRRNAIGTSSLIPTLEIKEVGASENFTQGSLLVKTASVNHTIETIAYRFEFEGKSVVVSGDLYYSESLIALANNADLLIIDGGAVSAAVNSTEKKSQGNTSSSGALTASSEIKSHSSFDEVISMVALSKVKKVVFTHLNQKKIDEAAVRSALIAKGAGCTVLFATDGLEIIL